MCWFFVPVTVHFFPSACVALDDKCETAQQFCPLPLAAGSFCGTEGMAVLDTGFSDGIMFDSESINLDSKGYDKSVTRLHALFGKRVATAWSPVPFTLDSVDLPGVTAIRNELAPVRRIANRSEFLAGMECFKGRTLSFGVNIQNVRLQRADDSTQIGVTIPLRWDHRNCPLVEVRIPVLGGIDVMLDTGNTGTISLTRERLNSLVRMGHAVRLNRQHLRIDGLGNQRNREKFVLRRVTLAGCTFVNVPVDADETEHLGTSLLRYFAVTLDFSRNIAVMRVPAGRSTPIDIPHKGSGISCAAIEDDRIRVSEIDAVSSAEAAGLKVDDIIFAINGKPVSEYSYWDRVDVFSQSGTTLRLGIERDGERRDVDLNLRYDFPYPPEWPPETPEFNPD